MAKTRFRSFTVLLAVATVTGSVALAQKPTPESAAWAPHRATKVLYAGKAGGHREAAFGEFLKRWFDSSKTIPLGKLSMARARDFDVVIVDWVSQYGNDGYDDRAAGLHGVPSRLGDSFTKPFITMTYTGSQIRPEGKLNWL